jgi:hypothetical protein
MKARLCPQGGVANPRHGEAMAPVCALPCSQIHHFHLSRYFRLAVLVTSAVYGGCFTNATAKTQPVAKPQVVVATLKARCCI